MAPKQMVHQKIWNAWLGGIGTCRPQLPELAEVTASRATVLDRQGQRRAKRLRTGQNWNGTVKAGHVDWSGQSDRRNIHI